MYQTILLKVPGRPNNKPVVILSGLRFGRKSVTNHFSGAAKMLSRTLSKACSWVKCNCTPGQILRFAFCEKVSMAVIAAGICAMWWHNITIVDNITAQGAGAIDLLRIMPWIITLAFRTTADVTATTKKGGEA